MPTKTAKIYNVDNLGSSLSCSYAEVSTCPVCHHALVPERLSGYYIEHVSEFYLGENSRYTVSIMFFCPHCRHTFTVEYDASRSFPTASSLNAYYIRGIYPQSFTGTSFSPDIKSLSPMFVTTYHQSEEAQTRKLTEVAGCGYRKSVEFLVKDYLCHKMPDEVETIKTEFLGTSIKRITENRIRVLAERASWIGNDATHYVKKHEALDIEDMKQFIKALVVYIDSELTFDAALSVLPK